MWTAQIGPQNTETELEGDTEERRRIQKFFFPSSERIGNSEMAHITEEQLARKRKCITIIVGAIRTKAIHSQGKLRKEHGMRKEQEHIVEGATRTTAFLLRACVSQTLYQCTIWAGPFQTTVAAHTDVSTHRFRSPHSFGVGVGEDELEWDGPSWRRRHPKVVVRHIVYRPIGATCATQTKLTIGSTWEFPKNSNHPPQNYSSSPARVHSPFFPELWWLLLCDTKGN